MRVSNTFQVNVKVENTIYECLPKDCDGNEQLIFDPSIQSNNIYKRTDIGEAAIFEPPIILYNLICPFQLNALLQESDGSWLLSDVVEINNDGNIQPVDPNYQTWYGFVIEYKTDFDPVFQTADLVYNL